MATAEEGANLRKAGIQKDILVLGGILKDEIDIFNYYSLTPVVSDFYHLELLKQLSKKRIHLKFDTGMHRLGFYEADIPKLLESIKRLNIYIEGVMSHFPSADIDPSYTKSQINRFKTIVRNFYESGINPQYIHLQNSAGLIYDCDFCNLVRVGLVLYGEKPFENFPLNVENCMYVKSRLISIKNVKKGDKISYTGSFKAPTSMKIGIVSFGYADGLPRVLSNRGFSLVNGKKAPYIGNITMDMSILDLSGIDAKIGDEVVIVGKQQNKEITFTDIAKLANTIPYEVMCGISKRVKRIEV